MHRRLIKSSAHEHLSLEYTRASCKVRIELAFWNRFGYQRELNDRLSSDKSSIIWTVPCYSTAILQVCSCSSRGWPACIYVRTCSNVYSIHTYIHITQWAQTRVPLTPMQGTTYCDMVTPQKSTALTRTLRLLWYLSWCTSVTPPVTSQLWHEQF